MSILDEQKLPFSRIAAEVGRKFGKRPHTSTFWRWHMKGLRRGDKVIRLEAWRLGGTLVTSLNAVQRFTEKLAELAAQETTESPAKLCTARQVARSRQQEAERAERECDEAGI